MLSFEALKNRLNEIYRCNAILESYENSLLKNSELLPEREKEIEQAKADTTTLAREILSTISTITGRAYDVQLFIQPLDIAYDLLKSEHFFAARELIDGLLAVYEKNFSKLVEQCNINPLDRLRFYKMHFI